MTTVGSHYIYENKYIYLYIYLAIKHKTTLNLKKKGKREHITCLATKIKSP